MLLLHGDDADDPFRACQHSAFHLEVRDSYATPSDSEPLRRFLNGEPMADDYAARPWIRFMRDTVARGVHISRARVVTQPHSDYQHWLLTITAGNIAVGEDIRYVPRHLAGDVPSDDWWLFDDEQVGFNLVDRKGRPAGMAVTMDPEIVGHCRSVRKRLWELAIPFAKYVGRNPIRGGNPHADNELRDA
ncbi:DUF6879 family protein [Nocardia aurantia]|uniref:DUF6879 domain-containing protein n=1 Tax=Nocardia aurantia TaxID=2585199 RepID=A0A7K0DWZ2_9NOCA|nr:DUF6879 family protein [Nocardia aurantia]MQY29832.1 hypothetical protein [Nocardia aurantia]